MNIEGIGSLTAIGIVSIISSVVGYKITKSVGSAFFNYTNNNKPLNARHDRVIKVFSILGVE